MSGGTGADAQGAPRPGPAFQALHASGCFVLPNPWDVGSAVFLESCGFSAVATSSAGFAFTRAAPDAVAAISLEDTLAHTAEMAAAVSVPVNADFQNGHADDPEEVAANVRACVATGVGGLSIEDATGRVDAPLYGHDLALERVRAAREAIDASGSEVVLTARCEAWLLGLDGARRTALERLVAFAELGADCLYAPGVRDPEAIREIVAAVAPRPVNVLVSAPAEGLTLRRLEDLGVRRVSVGSALARVAWGAFIAAAREIRDSGTFEGLGRAAAFAELNALFEAR